MKTTILFLSFLYSLSLSAQNPVQGQGTPGTSATGDVVSSDVKGTIKKAHVFFVEPKDGATVAKTFKVKMGVDGYTIRPAGEAPDEVTSGHHHLIIDGEAMKAGIPIPKDEKNIHFGKGETETEVTLKPGKHKLTLQFADGAHRSFGPMMSQTITVNVR